MKIKQLDIAGFRSLKNVSWQPGDLNVVIGQNGTGKSNLLRSLELLAASADGKMAKFVQASGGMLALLWDGAARLISFRVLTAYQDTVLDDSLWEYEDEYKLELRRGMFDPLIHLEKWISRCRGSNESDKGEDIIIDRKQNKIIYGGQELSQSDKKQETVLSLLNQLSYASGVRFTYRGKTFREELAEIAIYHDINVSQTSKIRQAAVASYEEKAEPDGQNLIPVLHTLYTTNRDFKRNIDSAMRVAFGNDYEELVFPPAADQRIQLRIRWKSLRREQSSADLSDGTLRFLLLMTVLNAPDPPMLIAIDEPETGLHPSMLPIITEFAVEASSRTQVVFTTHSPQFLDAFTDTKPTTTVARWENGETLLTTLEGEELKYWLAEYSLGELFRSGELEAMTT